MLKKILSLTLCVVMLASLWLPAIAAEEIVITPHDSACTMVGDSWTESTSEKVQGPTGKTSYYKGKEVRYSAEGISGKYDLFVYNIPYASTPDRVEAAVIYKDGSKTVILDYANNPKGWLPVGTFEFSGAASEGVTFTVGANSSYAFQRAIAVKFTPNEGEALKVTDAGAEPEWGEPTVITEENDWLMGCANIGFSKTGTWKQSSLNGPTGEKSWYTTEKGATATYYPNIAKGDNITVAYLKVGETVKEDPSVKLEVFAEGETHEFVFDLASMDGTGWLDLGTYSFAGDNSEYIKVTKISDSSSTTRSADLRFYIKSQAEVQAENSPLKGTDMEIIERLGMLVGDGSGITEEYLNTVPTRVQAAVLVLRLRGLEETAKAYVSDDNFADGTAAEWSKNILAYIKAHPEYGMIGVGNNMFNPNEEINAQQYAKILLEALGYSYNTDFTWDQTPAKAAEVGLNLDYNAKFTVKNLAAATAKALELKQKDGKLTLLGSVIAEREGVVDDKYLSNPQALSAELEAAQLEMRHKDRGMIYNDDGNDTYKSYPEYPGDFNISTVDPAIITTENFLAERTTGIENTQTTTIMYCDGVWNSYHHESGGVTSVRKRDWSYKLKEYTGMDSLETKIDFGKKNGIEVMWSMRMNDTHDMRYGEEWLDPWKLEHMDCLFSRKAEAANELRYGVRFWSAVDYGRQEVRQHVYDIFKDTITRYDLDGLQLDFTRMPIYFKQVAKTGEATPENLERMNNMIRSIRTMMDQVSIEKNKPLMLSIIVPDSMGFNKALGLDVETWCKEDLIDMVAIRGTCAIQSWEDSVAEYAPYNVQLHANFDDLIAFEDGADLKQEALLAYRAGVDGIHMYNNFNPNNEIYSTLGSPETCGELDPNYKSLFKRTANYGLNVADSERFVKEISYSAK
ncbi:MAG: hypothetical protein IJ454_04600 [Clostridia bacterium]|nr:hypothetical protein [Clostridia bacterium]